MRTAVWLLIAFLTSAVGFADEVENGDGSETCVPKQSLDFADW